MKKEIKYSAFGSLGITIFYFAISFFYFYGAHFDPSTNSPFRKAFEKIIISPAFITFGFRYAGEEGLAWVIGVVIFGITWIIGFYLIKTIVKAYKLKKARSHNNG
ncbi:hypothetical protein [Adhaeribacter pallidiroseus]|uniref:hypothetical protein n=1 Tax=Adhaeribacter pallidiroseus TaxID=2072847 RepID=UPI000E1BF443|nr:hypothetical protein [Adhaeribacter pallidiroseus]